MTGREWAPGDVVVASCLNMQVRGIIDTDGRFYTTDQRVKGISSSAFMPDNLRPLLTLDPESDDDARTLIRAFWDHHNDDCDGGQAMRDAMRSLVAPPEPEEPEEPQGLGAVVIVKHAVYEWARAVRIGNGWSPWYYTDSSGNGGLRAWDDLVKMGVES